MKTLIVHVCEETNFVLNVIWQEQPVFKKIKSDVLPFKKTFLDLLTIGLFSIPPTKGLLSPLQLAAFAVNA